MKVIDKLIGDKVKQIWTDEIQVLAKKYHLSNTIVELDTVKDFHVYIPYIEGKEVTLGFDPEFITTLKQNGFDVHLQSANKTKGMTLFGTVTKKL